MPRNHALNAGHALWSGPVGPLRYPEVPITGAITLDSSAWNRMHVCSGTSANYTVTLPACAGHAGDMLGFRMAPLASLSKLVTLDGNASELIDSATTRVMHDGEKALLLCDGSNLFKIAGLPNALSCIMRIATNQTGVVTGTLTKVLLGQTDLDSTGMMADTTNNRMNIVRTGYYLPVGNVIWAALGAASPRSITQVTKNAGLVVVGNAEAYGAINANPSVQCVTPSYAFVAGDYVELQGFQNSGANQSIYGAASPGATTTLGLVEQPTW